MDVYKGIFFHVISVGVRVLFNDSSREKQPFAGVLQNRSQMFKRVLTKAVSRRCSVKKVFLEISQNSPENTCARLYFLIKLQVFSSEFCEISKKNFLTEHLWATASGIKAFEFRVMQENIFPSCAGQQF